MKRLILALAFIVASGPLKAQEEDLTTLVNNALTAMNAGDWQQALKLNTDAVTQHGADPQVALKRFGAQFGLIWYRKGMCELKLKMFADAMKSFETCYRDFPNGGDAPAGGGNIFHKMALLKWGEAAMGAENYELAIEQWKKFIVERDKVRDKYPQGAFHVNMAICHFRIDKLEEGIEHLEIAIKNKTTFPTQNAAIISGFQAFATAAISAKKEPLILDFVEKYRGDLMIAPFEMQRFSKIFMKLAGDAISAEMIRTALVLYQFVPPTQVAINDLRIHLERMGTVARIPDGSSLLIKAQLDGELTALEAEQRSPKSIEMIKLAAIAYIHEQNEHMHGAFAAYLQLESFHQKSESREDNLYHLVRTSSIINEVAITQKYGERFLITFPESKYKADVQKMMLSSLFFDGKYETCIEIAGDIIENKKAAEGTPEHDLALFVLGGSYFYTGQYDQAGPLLDQHVEKYQESTFIMSSEYFQASNASRLQFWSKAAKLLDAFLEKYKEASDQGYTPLALYDRANCHYAEDEPEGALVKLERIITEFADSPVLDQAYNLRGNVQQSNKELEAAEASYLKAIEVGEIRGNDSVVGEALYYLVALLGEQKKGQDPSPRLPDAVPYADKYWKDYSIGSPYRPQVAVAQVAALGNAGRGEEALKRLQEVISEMASNPEAVGLEEVINSYTEEYLKTHTPDELKEHYYNFPNIRNADKAARALLRVALIGVFEELGKGEEDEAKKRAAEAMVKILFQELKADFELKDLSNFILVRLGDYLREKTAAPREALPYYDEALSRQDQSYRFAALLGRADVYGQSAAKADLDKAVEDFERIFSDSDEKKQREFALYRIIEILMKKEDYAEAANRANEYLNREEGKDLGFSKFAPEVSYILAQSFEKRNMKDDAISMHVKVWSTYMGYIKISAPSVITWMELSAARNRPSNDPAIPGDRQGAYEGGYRYLELTGRFKDKMNKEDLAEWEKVGKTVDKILGMGGVKSMEQIKKEKEK